MHLPLLNNFGGEIPKLEPELLPETSAQTAENVKLFSRGLRSWKRPKLIFTPSVTGTLLSAYRVYNGSTDYWYTWAADVDAVKGPIAGDTTFRLYYTGDPAGQGWPKKTNLSLGTGASNYPADYLEMGVPPPDTAPSIGHSGGVGAAQTRVYVTTIVTSWGEESGPSPAATATGKIDDTWTVTPDSTVTGPSTKYDVTLTRIYRAYTNTAAVTDYYLAHEQAIGAGLWTDNIADSVLVTQGIIPSYTFGVVGSEWAPPPADMKGLVAGSNGIMAGFSKSIFCPCEPYHPHAYPPRYQKSLFWDIVVVIPFGSSFIVGTKGRPYIISGKHPSSMSVIQIERDDMPCIAKRGSTLSGLGALLPTPNGLALIGGGNPDHITEPFMDRDKWNSKCFPTTLVARAWNDKYIGFFDTGAGKKGVMLDRSNANGPVTFISQNVNGAYTDPETNKLYLIQDNKIYEWDGDPNNNSSFDWHSKRFVLPKPVTFGCYKVDADYSVLAGDFAAELAQLAADQVTNTAIMAALPAEAYPGPATIQDTIGSHIFGGYWQISATDDLSAGPGPNGSGIHFGGSLLVGGTFSTYEARTLTFQLYAMNDATNAMELKYTATLRDRKVKRLPHGYSSDRVSVRVQGNIPVNEIRVAEVPVELAQF